MSMSAAHGSNQSSRTCLLCSHGSADPDYVAGDPTRVRCFACFRAVRSQREDSQVDPPVSLQPQVRSELTEQQISHRRRMLEFALMQGRNAASR